VRVVDLDDERGVVQLDGLHMGGDRLADEVVPRAEHAAHTRRVVGTERRQQFGQLPRQGDGGRQFVGVLAGHSDTLIVVLVRTARDRATLHC